MAFSLVTNSCAQGDFNFQTAEEMASARLKSESTFRCDPAQPSSPTRSLRLTQIEYFNTIRDLVLPVVFDPYAATDPIKTEIATALTQIPEDGHASGFARLDDRVAQVHVDGYYYVADALSNAIASQETRLRTLTNAVAGGCYPANASLDVSSIAGKACVTAFINGFGRRAFRRPLTATETAKFVALNDGVRARDELFRSIIFAMMNSPRFLYHLEIDGTPSGNLLALSGFEMASRLSYFFAESMPSDSLLNLAQQGQLNSDEGLRSATATLTATSSDFRKARFLEFFLNWLGLPDNKAFENGPVFAAFAASAPGGNVTYDDMKQELSDLLQYYVWNGTGSMNDLILSNLFVTQSPALSAAYGVSNWQPGQSPIQLPADQRSGLLTRAIMLATGSDVISPLHRGITIRRKILCTKIDQPDPAKFPAGTFVLPMTGPDQTTRQVLTAKTSPPECLACHTQFNDVGFNLGRYDGLGRFSLEEKRFASDGSLINRLPVDASGIPHVSHADSRVAHDGIELSRYVADSDKVESCFVREIFRYTYRKTEQTGDNCEMDRMKKVLQSGGARKALNEFPLSPQFRTRMVGP